MSGVNGGRDWLGGAAVDGAAPKGTCEVETRRGLRCRRDAVKRSRAGRMVCTGHGGSPKAGGQRGNRSAVKHGLYSRALSADERLDAALAASSEGLDEEIAMLRLNFRRALAKGDVALASDASGALVAALKARHQMSDRSDRNSTRLNSSHANNSYAVFCL